MQTKWLSLVEACAGTLIGLVYAFAIQGFLFSMYGIQATSEQNAWIVFWMTVASIARSYFVRRIFNGAWLKNFRKKKNVN